MTEKQRDEKESKAPSPRDDSGEAANPSGGQLEVPREPPPKIGAGGKWVVIVLAIAALLGAGFGIATRVHSRGKLKDDTLASAAPIVKVIAANHGGASQEIVIPGTAQAFTDAPIYARTNGYVRRWYADIGARVRKGQVLADIDAPEIDQQLAQARADLGTAQANERLAKRTADRYAELAKTDSVSRQDADNAVETYSARRAATLSSLANSRRAEQLVSFEKVEAPFDGIITARNTDIGQLVDAGSSGGPARELFHIATNDRLRVFIGVPQTGSSAAVAGLPVDVTIPERPGRLFPGKVIRNAGSIDPTTRTLLVEIDMDNAKGEILPGTSVRVHLKGSSAVSGLLLPVSAVLFRSEGPRVAVLTNGNHAQLLPVTLGRDYGTALEITSGLTADSQVIDSPPDSLIDGQQVQIVRDAKPAGAPKS